MEQHFYPLIFEPLYKDYIWGGRNLEKLGKELPDGIVAESWEISCHQDGMSIIANGEFKGQTLEKLVSDYGEKFLGTLSTFLFDKKFPILLKLIDANEWLSVQVHPDDEYAKRYENDFGKTEMWYVLEAEPDATIIYGLTEKMSRDEFKKIIDDGKISNVLKSIPVQKGDVIYIPAGTVHAAGKGILIAEVQQNSNATYRLYDYDRKNPDGSSRPLHIDKALDTINFDAVCNTGKYNGLAYTKDGLDIRVIIADPHFCAEIIEVKESAQLNSDKRTFTAYTFLEGEALLSWNDGNMKVKQGTSVLIPANLGNYKLTGNIKAIRAYIGDIEKDIIEPLLSAGYSKEQMLSSIGGLDV